ncbi:MAG: trigger factor [Phycisphaerales bacterium]|nr:trigger factor [Phycisphaerales bacterium]
MSDSTAAAEGFEFKLEEAGPARKRMHICVTTDAIQAKLSDSMQTLEMQSTLPGFRKGRAPRHLLQRKFGEAIRADACQELIQDGCRRGLEAFSLQPLGGLEPTDPEANPTIVDGQPLELSVEFEVVPEFELPDLSTLELSRPTIEVEDKHIDEELERQCMRNGEVESLESSFKPKDRFLGKAMMYIDGEEEAAFQHEEILVVLPEKGETGTMLGLNIEDLGACFKRKKVGQVITAETTGPDSHEREDIQGKPLRIEYKIEVAERVSPCKPADLIEKFSLPSEDVLREQIRLALEQQRDEEQGNVLREQAMRGLSEAIEMELPERLSSQQITSDLQRIEMEMMQKGLTQSEIESQLADLRERSEENTKDNLKSWFIMQKIAQDQDIEVSEQEINGRIATMAMRQGVRADLLRAELVKHDRVNAIASSIRDRKAADWVVSQSTVKDISLDEWETKVKDQKAAASA